jgi:hypothetical protein
MPYLCEPPPELLVEAPTLELEELAEAELEFDPALPAVDPPP